MYQQISIIGNLGRDPDMRYTPSGQAVTNFSVATNRSYTNSNNERVKETTWFRVSAWGRLAETCNQYLQQGSKVMVVGRMSADKESGGPRIWKRQDGTPAASYEITADQVTFLDGAQGGSNGAHADESAEEEAEVPF